MILHCKIVINELDVKQYVIFALEDEKKATLVDNGVVVYNIFPKGDKVDMRTDPPFCQILPCPHCNSEHENKHDALKHINPKLGLSIHEVEKVAKERNITTSQAHLWLLDRA